MINTHTPKTVSIYSYIFGHGSQGEGRRQDHVGGGRFESQLCGRIMISLALKATKMTVIIILILMGINGAHASSTIEEDADSVRVVERCESIENITVFPGGYKNIPNEQVRELILREGGWEDNLTRLMNLVRVTVAHHINTWD